MSALDDLIAIELETEMNNEFRDEVINPAAAELARLRASLAAKDAEIAEAREVLQKISDLDDLDKTSLHRAIRMSYSYLAAHPKDDQAADPHTDAERQKAIRDAVDFVARKLRI